MLGIVKSICEVPVDTEHISIPYVSVVCLPICMPYCVGVPARAPCMCNDDSGAVTLMPTRLFVESVLIKSVSIIKSVVVKEATEREPDEINEAHVIFPVDVIAPTTSKATDGFA